MFKKIFLMIILAMSVVGCEPLSPKEWKEYHKRKVGETCYRRASGTVYCKDDYGNRTY